MPRSYLLGVVLTTAVTLAGCSGGGAGGGGVNSVASVPGPSTPPPVARDSRTPLPPTPATTTGSYQAFSTFAAFDYSNAEKVVLPDGRQFFRGGEIAAELQLAPQGSVSIAVDAATRTYTLTAPVGPYQFPSDRMTMSASSDLGYSRNGPINGPPDQMTPEARAARGDLVSHTVSAGTTSTGLPRIFTSFVTLYNVGQLDGSPRYLSVAQWGQLYQENANGVLAPGNVRPLQVTSGVMVFGPRTEPGDMPLSGRASYALHSLVNPPSTDDDGNVVDVLGDTLLEVDFASKALSGRYDRKSSSDTYKTDDYGDTVIDHDGKSILLEHIDTTVHATGSITLGNDSGFNLPLAGSGTVHSVRTDQPSVTDLVQPVKGLLSGAFFGPQAAEVGGIANLPQIGSDGTVYQSFSDFAGIRAGR